MKKVTKAWSHLSLKDIMKKIRNAKDADKRMRWHIVYTTMADARDSRVIALQLGCSRRLVTSAISEYNRSGANAFHGKGSGSGRTNSYIKEKEEREFLLPFIHKAKKGLISTVSEIKIEYENKIGKKVWTSTITRLLKRQGWRKITTRPFHPLRNKEKQNDFKKNSLAWFPLW